MCTLIQRAICCFFFIVPVDVFSPNSDWSGFYEYLGKRQASTITVTGFNASSGRVNVTLLETSGVSIKLSGKTHYDVTALQVNDEHGLTLVAIIIPYFGGETTVNPVRHSASWACAIRHALYS